MPRKKGRFVSSRALIRAELSSARLKTYHEELHNINKQDSEDTMEVILNDDQTPPVATTVDLDQVVDNASTPTGRRIVEIEHLANQLKHCSKCASDLNLRNIIKEDRYGLGSVLTIICRHCGELNKVETNKRHRHDGSSRGPKSFVVNTKAAIGMVHTGIGVTHINSFMSALEIPAVNYRTLKKAESKVGQHIISLAKESCRQALKEEEEELSIKIQSKSAGVSVADGATNTTDSANINPNAEDDSCTLDIQSSITRSEMSSSDSPGQSRSTGTDIATHDLSSADCESDQLQNNILSTTVDKDYDRHNSHVLTDHSYARNNQKDRLSCEFKYDMAWQKRGSGRCYDSRSGVGTVIGNLTGKVCAYGIRSKNCKKCDCYSEKGSEIPEHNCCRNWAGSSKAMEPDVAGELAQEIERSNVDVGVLIMDDDCTTIARVRKDLPHDVDKWSDQNHTVKHIGNNLYALQKKHKTLSVMVIKHIQKCFNYALAQNKGDVVKFTAAVQQIIPHLFGEHENCGLWCGYNKNPQTYKHRGLPYGKPLTGAALRTDLDAVMGPIIKNAAKIAPGASTKDVESFNSMVATKAPKRCHYSGSDSLLIRTSCAVAQKNTGFTYLNKVNSRMGLSPGKFLKKHALKRNTIRKRKIQITNTLEYKRRKLQKKSKCKLENILKEVQEGPTYKSGIATTDTDVTEIPPPKTSPIPENVHIEQLHNVNKIFCDIETTSLQKDADIVQIAAICNEHTLNNYIMPSKQIAPSASDVTGLSVCGKSMFYRGQKVDTVSLVQALDMFVSFMQQHNPCILVGHNFFRFDFPLIFRAFDLTLGVDCILRNISGIADTLPLFKATYKDLERYSQEYLVTHFVKESYSAHNALGDVRSLQKLCTVVGFSNEQFADHSRTSQSAVDIVKNDIERFKNCQTFTEIMCNKIISKGMTEKLANSGLCLVHLQLAVRRAGREGLKQLLTEPNAQGKPRVTKNSKIIDKLFNYLEQSQ